MRVLYPPYISWGEKKTNFCINNHLLFQFYTQEFEYLRKKTFILPKWTTVSKCKEAESKLWADRCNRKEGGKDFLMYKRGLTDLTEAFGPLLRNAQPSTETPVLHQFSIPYFTSTNSSCSSSFQLLLLQNLPGIERCGRKVYHSPDVVHYLHWKSYWEISQCKKETSSLTTA